MEGVRYTAGDFYAAQREKADAPAEWSLYVHWRALKRDGQTSSDFEGWLDTIPMNDIRKITELVTATMEEPDPEAEASSPSLSEVV